LSGRTHEDLVDVHLGRLGVLLDEFWKDVA